MFLTALGVGFRDNVHSLYASTRSSIRLFTKAKAAARGYTDENRNT